MAGPVATADRGYARLPLPFGWFGVAMSEEIAVGEIRTAHDTAAVKVEDDGEIEPALP